MGAYSHGAEGSLKFHWIGPIDLLKCPLQIENSLALSPKNTSAYRKRLPAKTSSVTTAATDTPVISCLAK